MSYESPIIKMATLAYAFNGKVALKIGDQPQVLLEPEQASRLGCDLLDAKHKADLERIP